MESEGNNAVVPREAGSIIGWIESTLYTASQTSAGQALFRLVNSFLWVIEKCAQWSLPAEEIAAEENSKVFAQPQLVRPLPWILFLPGLVILRAVRFSLNVGAFIFRYPQIQPSGIVKFMQKSRRRLRALNMRAVKSVRRNSSFNKDKRLSMLEAKQALIRSIKLTLSTMSCLDNSNSSPSPPPTKIRISHMDLDTATTPDEKSTTESLLGSPDHHDMKRRYSQVSSASDEESSEGSEDETLEAKLERLAMSTSADDPDFNPIECSTATDSSSSSSENELEREVSTQEIKELETDMLEFIESQKTLTELESSTAEENEAADVEPKTSEKTCKENETADVEPKTTEEVRKENETADVEPKTGEEVCKEKETADVEPKTAEGTLKETETADVEPKTVEGTLKENETADVELKTAEGTLKEDETADVEPKTAVEVFKDNEKKECSLVALEDEDRTKPDSAEIKFEKLVDDAKHVAGRESKSQDEQKKTTTSEVITDFMNGERNSAFQPEMEVRSEVTNGVVQNTPVSTKEACVPPQARTSISKENSSHVHERKGYKHKKTGRRWKLKNN